MGQMEHLLNVYASRATKNSVANFVGYAQVMPHEASRTLTEGLWLVSPADRDTLLLELQITHIQ